MHQQAGRYLALAAAQYGFTAAATAILPRLFGLDEQVAFLISAGLAATVNFIVLRTHVFHGRSSTMQGRCVHRAVALYDGAVAGDAGRPSNGPAHLHHRRANYLAHARVLARSFQEHHPAGAATSS